MDRTSKDTDMILLNESQKKWSLEDYINFYAKQGDEKYIKFLKIAEKSGLPIKQLMCMSGSYGGTSAKQLKKGNMILDLDLLQMDCF